MGFTFSHPALILPFRFLPRKFYSLSGLVIGSIVPDFEYFIRLNNLSLYSHSIWGLFWFGIPVGLLVGIIFHHLIRDILISNLPSFFKFRFARFQGNNWLKYLNKNLLIVTYSILLGSLTHVFWDSFTSFHGYFVKANNLFMVRLNFMGNLMSTYKILKYISSLLGIAVIGYAIFQLPKTETIKMEGKHKYYWTIIIALFIPVIIFRIFLIDKDEISLNGIIKITVSSCLIALLLTSIIYAKKNKLDAF